MYFCNPQKTQVVLKEIGDFLLNTPVYSPQMILILIVTGIFVGFVNTLAGMATALSYALFMAMGMPINVANGTSRVGVLAQFAVSSFLFKKKGYLDTNLATKTGIPIALGSIAGAQLAAMVNTSIMEVIMGLTLPAMAILLLINKKKGSAGIKEGSPGVKRLSFFKFIAFALIGAYGGFTHAGVGILILFGGVYMLGLDLMKANGIKQFAVLLYTPLALFVFIWHQQVNWLVAAIYAAGNVTGAVIASKVAVKWGVKIINVVIAIAVFAMSFWLIYKQFI